MKPVTFERFFKAVNKYFQSELPEPVELEGENGMNNNAYIYVKENKKIIKIYLKEIHFIEGLNEYIRIHKSYIVPIPRIRAFNATTIELDNTKLRIGRNYKNKVFSALQYKQDI